MSDVSKITFSERNPEKDVFKEVDLRARKFMSADSKLTYSAAVKRICLDDPDLIKAWHDTTTPVHHNKS